MSFNLINLILNNLSSKNIKLDKNNNPSKSSSTNFDNILFEVIQSKVGNLTKKSINSTGVFKENLSFLSFSVLNTLEENIKKNLNKILDILGKENLTLNDLVLLKKYIDKVLKDLKIIVKKDNVSIDNLNKFIFDIFSKIKNTLNLEHFSINQNKKPTKTMSNQFFKEICPELVKKNKGLDKGENIDQDTLKNIISFFNLLSASISEIINEASQNGYYQGYFKKNFLVSKHLKDLKDNEKVYNPSPKSKVFNKDISNSLVDSKNLNEMEKGKALQTKVNYFNDIDIPNISKSNLAGEKSKFVKGKINKSVLSSENSILDKKTFLNKNLENFQNFGNFNIENFDSQRLKPKASDNFFNPSKELYRGQEFKDRPHIDNKDNNLNFNFNLDKQNSIIKNYNNTQDVKVGKTSFFISEQRFPNLRVRNVYQNQENLLKIRYHLATGELALILKVENMPPLTLQLMRKEIESILDSHSIFKRRVRIKNEKREKRVEGSEESYSIVSKRI